VPKQGFAAGKTYSVFGATLAVERCFGEKGACKVAMILLDDRQRAGHRVPPYFGRLAGTFVSQAEYRDDPGFRRSVSLGDNGKTLVVGAPFEPSNAIGIDGDQTDTSAPERGAVWLY
jgi:hypothetical protein